MKKLFLLGFILIGCQFISAQKVLNNYKYVIVPKYFEFQNKADSYQINSLTEFLLKKKGLNTVFSDAVYPEDLKHDRCLSLKVNLLENSNFSRLKIKAAFVNCNNQVVYTTQEGVSKDKDYKKAYHEAIRNAFKSLEGYKYSYEPKLVDIESNPKPKVKTPIKKTVKQKPVVNKKPTKKIVLVKAPKKAKVKKPKVYKKKKEIKEVHTKAAKLVKKAKKESPLIGLYIKNNKTFKIEVYKNYFILSKQLKKGDAPIGFIYKTSLKISFVLKTKKGTYPAYLTDKGDFVVDEIGEKGIIKSVIYLKNQ